MKSIWNFVGLLVIVALVASLSCFLTGQIRSGMQPHPSDFHHWVHQQLHLTAEQDKTLDAQEADFETRKRLLNDEIQQANADLAAAIQQDKAYSPRVVAATERIHRAQTDLEKAALEHIFAMKNFLTPDQFDQLLKLTGDALTKSSEF